jgi:ribosomal protein S18 acetylase RimI-like enzyme
MVIEPTRNDEHDSLLRIAVETGLFTFEDAEGLLGGILIALAEGSLPDGHAAVACRTVAGGEAIGWSYFAPDQYADGVWNVWWIGVLPSYQGTGAGRALLTHVESRAAEHNVRVIVIETSDQNPMAKARRFYTSFGYAECGRIPDFYATGEAKVVFSRSFANSKTSEIEAR